MKLFGKKKCAVPLDSANGLHVGDVVRHKVTGARAVIIALKREPSGEDWARVSVGWKSDDEFDTTVAEIEKFSPAPSTEG